MSLSFLLSSERSGSNFIVKSVDAHSDICGPATKHLISPIARNEFRFHPSENEVNWSQLVQLTADLMNCGFSEWRYTPNYNDLKKLANPGDYRGLIAGIFMSEAGLHGKTDCFVKENLVYEFYPFLNRIFPEARYVYLVRDPRDMALSWKKHQGHVGGVAHAAKQWQWDQQNFLFLEHHLGMTQPESILRVKYEDLVSNFKKTLNRVCLHLGSEPDFCNFEDPEHLSVVNSRKEAAWRNLSRPVMEGNHKKYITELSTDEIKIVESICANEMNFLGYDFEYPSALSSSGLSVDIEYALAVEKKEFPQKWSDAASIQRDIKRKFYEYVAAGREE